MGGFLGFICASIGTWLGLLCLTAAGVHVNTLEYSGLAKRAFQEHGERLVDVAIIILTFGAQLGYILVVGNYHITVFPIQMNIITLFFL